MPLNQAPGFENPEVYHPRWTNHPRFIALSGPYNQGGANQVRSGGTQIEVWLGRFSDDFSRDRSLGRGRRTTAAAIPIPTSGSIASKSPIPARPAGAIGPGRDRPGQARDPNRPRRREPRRRRRPAAHAGPIPTPQSILPYRHALVVNEYDVVTVVEGQYRAEEDSGRAVGDS